MTKPEETDSSTALTVRRRRLAGAIVLAALLAIGGGVWASTLGGTPMQSTAQPTPSGAVPGATPSGTGDSTASGPGSGGTESATATAPPIAAPSASEPVSGPADPAPVDRTGKTEQELAEIQQPVAPPVELNAKKEVKAGVSATITDLQAVDGEAHGIGEIAGPALRFKITVVNETGAEVPLEAALVNVSFGKDEAPASALSGPDPLEFPKTVPSGTSASGIFIFAVPLDARDDVRIYFNLDAGTPVAAFAGKAPA